ncbi:unnamed protein product [Kuraishia capsulata CBS 1993]|uniref:MADS-box domain-containing protein n=1 Tax=Kuraishia capsulata CBS 1993 TaxID=1382522 RepID=W6MGR0_9ASCO|nr:uncharacterized protein KUCA_T00000739001 [Kuraishia capsulata CBS 1993]CDK24773.1 unnamed protein product [Kuraishia capsulata CBS 1993]
MGRRKIEIEPISEERNRTVTFAKRKAGLFKKAHELSVLCQADLAVIIIGNNHKLFEYSSVDMDDLLTRYSGYDQPHEQKTPKDYGDYEKKSRVSSDQDYKRGSYDKKYVAEEADNDEESEDDDDVPPSKRVKRTRAERDEKPVIRKTPNRGSRLASMETPPSDKSTLPPFTSGFASHTPKNPLAAYPTSSPINEFHARRPQLRVTIPKSQENKSENDSAVTVSKGIPENGRKGSSPQQPSSQSNSSDSTSRRLFGNQSDSSAVLGNLTSNGNNQKYFANGSTVLPQLDNDSAKSTPLSATAPGGNIFGLPQLSPSSQLPLPNPTPSQNPHQQQLQQQLQQLQQQQNHGNPRNGVYGATSNPGTNTANGYGPTFMSIYGNGPTTALSRPFLSGANPGEQTPVSALPSKYVNDLFPSPNNFYSNEWNIPFGTGTTPLPTSAPHLLPMPNGGTSATPSTQPGGANHLIFNRSGSTGGNYSEMLPSPLQMMMGTTGGNQFPPAFNSQAYETPAKKKRR